MSRNAKQIIAIIAVGVILAVAWYGSYLPMRKAQMFIATLQGLQATPPSSMQDLDSRLSAPLDYPSPIGQEELVRNMANSVLTFVQRAQSPTSTAEIVGLLHAYYDPILIRGRGMSFGQDLYLMGAINEMAYVTTHSQHYLADSIHYYEEAHQLGMNRPQALYGLFDVYRFAMNIPSTTATGQQILSLWPTDANTTKAFQDFMSTLGKATSTKASAK